MGTEMVFIDVLLYLKINCRETLSIMLGIAFVLSGNGACGENLCGNVMTNSWHLFNDENS